MDPPPPIDHRSMEHHYTESLGHPAIKFYPLQSAIDSMEHHYTKYDSHIEECKLNLWVMMTLSFTPLLQSTIDLWNTTTPNKFHI